MKILVGITCGLILSVFADRIIGHALNSRGYFTALPPNKTLIFETSEFNTVATISAQGIRNDMGVIPKPKGVYRILALGDSFTFGWGVNLADSWPKQFEHTLKDSEVINAGAPGIELSRINMICRAYADRFDIDEIIVALYTDDILQAGDFGGSRTFWDKVASTLWPTFPRLKEPVVEKSYSVADVSIEWKDMAKRILKRDPTILLTLHASLRDDFIAGRLNPQFVELAHQTPQFYSYLLSKEFMGVAMGEIEHELKEIRSCVKNIPITVISIPASALVSEKYQSALRDLGFSATSDLLKINPDEVIEKIAQKHGLSFASVLSDFRADGCPGCYYFYDGHLTFKGQERVVKGIQLHD